MRELLVSHLGALLLDTPGIRSVGMWEIDEGLADAFADVEELASNAASAIAPMAASPVARSRRRSPKEPCRGLAPREPAEARP